MRFTIRGQVWRLTWVRDFADERAGEADDEQRAIRILRDLPEREKLRVVLHELLHAECWDLAEECVDRVSTTMRDVLWRLGWRPRRSEAADTK